MQYKTGTVAVENGSATVTGTGTLFQTAAIPVGAPFVVVGHAAPYFVGAVNSETEIVLTAPYQGDTASGATYALVVDFTPHLGLPLIGKGDIETATILARALVEIDAQVNAIGAAGLAGEWMGPWSAGTYTVGQVVSHLGSAWICNAVTTTAEPGDSSGDWELAVAKGDTGAQGDPGVIGLWRDAWSAGTYVEFDAVHHNGSAWICVVASTTAEPGDSSGDWSLAVAAGADGEPGLNWLGDWSAGTYQAGDGVHHLGSAWRAATTTTAEPGDSSGDWDLFAAKGEAGSAAETTFDNTASGLAATDVQEAIDETVARIDAIPDAVAMAIVFGS